MIRPRLMFFVTLMSQFRAIQPGCDKVTLGSMDRAKFLSIALLIHSRLEQLRWRASAMALRIDFQTLRGPTPHSSFTIGVNRAQQAQ